ncbi:hypothetical protein VTN00DRAFT_9888 [Thermoascus crustaceus]|uniref:uncharacterized protein n=1 Tax=Thermoascus crustaceus TaxID=5088 RepID=UPI003743A4FF
MADVPSNRTRIVPIMAGRRYTSKTSKDARSAPKQQQPRVSMAKSLETESLKLPCLEELGLYALPTKGDGNCLYYALSDQLYGDWSHFDEIRARLANHMTAHEDYFMNFTAAVGGERRAPRRAAAAKMSSSSYVGPAASVKDQRAKFENRVAESRKNGVWGGSEEIQAFCQSYKRDVRVYMESGIQNFRDVNAPEDEEREVVHIAFHNFDHYSSVRSVNGPHTGLPCIPNSKAVDSTKQESEKVKGGSGTVVDIATPWKISFIQEGLGGRYDYDTIVEMLQQCRGDIERAFSNLLDDVPPASSSQTPSSPTISNAPSSTVPTALQPGFRSRLQTSSRSSSRHSTASKRSANDSDDDVRHPARRNRGREQKRRILPNVTVGIAFRDENENDLVSLRLRVSPDTVAEQANSDDSTAIGASSDVAAEKVKSPPQTVNGSIVDRNPNIDGKASETKKSRGRKRNQSSREEVSVEVSTSPRLSESTVTAEGEDKKTT